MKIKIKAIALVLATTLLATPVLAEYKRVTSEKQMRAQLVGKVVLDAHGNWYRWNADGTLEGQLKDGRKVVGAWEWRRKFLCRNVRVGDTELGTDCQSYEIDGKSIRYTGDKGKGETKFLTLQ